MAANQRMTRPPFNRDNHGQGYYPTQQMRSVNTPQMAQQHMVTYNLGTYNPNMMAMQPDRQQHMTQAMYVPTYNQQMMYAVPPQYIQMTAAQGQPHSSPTPPAPAPEQQAPQPQRTRSKGITIKDPNTGQVVKKENLAQNAPTLATKTQAQTSAEAQVQDSRANFAEQFHSQLSPTGGQTKPKTKPTAILQHPPTHEDKTPEKALSGIEISVQTTPSLKIQSPKPVSKVPAPPKFEEPSISEKSKEQVMSANTRISEPIETDPVIPKSNIVPDRTKVSDDTPVVTDDVNIEIIEFKSDKSKDLDLTIKCNADNLKDKIKMDLCKHCESLPCSCCIDCRCCPCCCIWPSKEISETKEISEIKDCKEIIEIKDSKEKKISESEKSEKSIDEPVTRISESDVTRISESENVAVNGIKGEEEEPKELVIEIPKENGNSDIRHDEPDIFEDESSGSKDQFETPPATPSEVDNFATPTSISSAVIVKEVEIAPAVNPAVVAPSVPSVTPVPVPSVTPVPAPSVTPVPAPSVTPIPAPSVTPVPVPSATPAPVPAAPMPVADEPTPAPAAVTPTSTPVIAVEDKEEELEEGEIEEEVTVMNRPYRYTREELLVFREAQDKQPKDLPKLECVSATPLLKDSYQRQANRSQNQFVPSWEQGGRSRSRGADRSNRNNDNKQSMGKPRVIEHVMAPQVTRKKSSNAWLSKQEQGPVKVNPNSRDQQITHLKGQVTAILNKITPQNFKELSVKIVQLGFDDIEKLDIAVEIVFDKAVLEPAFSQTYANLCKVMSSIQFPDEPTPKVSPFRRTLLNRCQKEFLKEKTGDLEISDKIRALPDTLTDAERNREIEELQYVRGKLKKKMLGNINFIGELYNLSMISAKIIMVNCIQFLLEKNNDEESVECLSKLFVTVGQKLDTECAKVANQADIFEKHFGTFKSYTNERSTYCARIRFMVQDVVDLRENKWIPRREEVKPQKIDDIHREHAKQEAEKKMEAAVAQQSRKGKRNDSRDERQRGSRDGRMSDKNEWQNSQQRKLPSNIDISKLQHGPQGKIDVSSMQLGPGRTHNWGKGSGTGSGANSPLSGSKEDLSSSTNRFDLIKGDKKTVLCQGKTTSAPAPRGKLSERESAVANVSKIGKRRTPSPSPVRNTSKVDPLSDENIRTKTKSILTEYYSGDDIEEAVACVREELQLVKKHAVFVESAIMLTLEQKVANNSKLGELFHVLFNEKLLHVEALLEGLQQPLEVAEDLSIDVPAIYGVFGRLIGKCVAKNHVTLSQIKKALTPLEASRKVGVVVCEILKDALKDIDEMQLQKKWAKERMSWQSICDNYEDLIEKYSLEFLSTSTEIPPDAPITPDLFQQDVFNKMLNDKASNDKLFAYVEKMIPVQDRTKSAFISSLVTAVCKSCLQVDIQIKDKVSFNDDSLKELAPILIKYVQSGKDNLQIELDALDAVQLLVCELAHPRDLGYSIFCAMDDNEIITPEGFKNWNDNSKEQQGRGVMRAGLKDFFTELSDNDSDTAT